MPEKFRDRLLRAHQDAKKPKDDGDFVAEVDAVFEESYEALRAAFIAYFTEMLDYAPSHEDWYRFSSLYAHSYKEKTHV